MPIINPKTDGNEHLMQEAYPDPDELETHNVRFATIMGNQYRLEAVDPYALWCVKNRKGGPVPHELSGNYTSPSEAESAIKAYLTAKAFKESLKSDGPPANTHTESISDQSSPKPTQHIRKGLNN